MSMNGTAKIAFSLVAAIALVLASLGIVLVTYNRPIHESKHNCSVQVKKCNEPTHLYHVGAGRCIRNGDKSGELCGGNMVISPVPACPLQGQCECDYERNEDLVYYDVTRQCYSIETQGPCEDGKVVAVSSNRTMLSCKQEVEGKAHPKSGGLGGFVRGKCKPGSYEAFSGQCVPAVAFGDPGDEDYH